MCVQCKALLFVYDELNRRPGGTEFTKQEIAWREWTPGLSGGSRRLLPPLKGIFAPFQWKDVFTAYCSVGLVFNLASSL